MPTLIFTNLCWGGDGSPQFDCKDNVATLSFPTWSDFSTSKITIENANNKTISQDNFGFEWRNGVVYITPNEALTVGVYDIHFSCKSGTTTYSLCYGYKGDIYLECEDVGWFDLQFQNWKNERYLVQTNNGLETTPAYADRTTFGSRRDMCGIEVGSDGFAYPTQNGLLVQFATQTYIHHGEKSLWAFTYDGWYMAADTKGTVYFTKNLTDECYWIVAP